MRSTVVDLPQALAHARDLAREAGHADLVEHREADILRDDLGHGYDVALLSNILHHFDPDTCRSLLSRVGEALTSGGTVAVWERDRPARGSKITDMEGAALFFRLTSSAAAYPGDEYAAWLAGLGFDDVRVRRPVLSPGSVLVTARRR
jgi:O-methyltransferase domain